ncbi:uncharacterized protein IAS62_004678 [Cryptococcus decagattii]|uniref:Cardiolipin-specific phospholipase n=1 Tax=Cryptococcus decagattii TaxID=1859122 RepID=A0ABZ2B1I5_9TREE
MASLTPPLALSSSTPLPPASRNIPTDFRSSLSAWWSTSSFKETRIAEERLLRRLAMYEPTPAPAMAPPLPATATVGVHEQGGAKSWFGFAKGSSGSTISLANQSVAAQDKKPQPQLQVPSNSASAVSSSGLVATLRNVFITTPSPADAPAHPADPRDLPPGSGHGPQHEEKKSHHHISRHCKDDESRLKDYINTLEISTPANKDSKEAVVVLHGYAAALGFFFRNWESIATSSAATSRRTFFLDWLGMGLILPPIPFPPLFPLPRGHPIPRRSRRTLFPRQLGKLATTRRARENDTGRPFAGRLPGECVRGEVPRTRFRFGTRFPGGDTTRPRTQAETLRREGSETSQELEGAVDAAEMELGTGPARGRGGKEGAKGEAKEWEKRREESVVRRGMMKFFVWGWERGLSPFSILRTAGPFGPLWVGKYSSRRFARQTEEDVRDLHAYIYGTSVMKGSGEYCISHILAPGAYARIPILDRIDRLKVPVTFMYGDNDWMDVQGGHDSAAALAKAGNNNCSVHVVPDAGHHLYLDNPEVSNKLLDEAIRAVPKVL